MQGESMICDPENMLQTNGGNGRPIPWLWQEQFAWSLPLREELSNMSCSPAEKSSFLFARGTRSIKPVLFTLA